MTYCFNNKKIIKRLSSFQRSINREIGYQILNLGIVFIELIKAFIKVLIIEDFNLKCHNRIQTNVLSYDICEIIDELNLNNL